jgi:hypothetical protein
MKLTYTAVLSQTDSSFNTNGYVFTFTGVQTTGATNPSSSDLTALANAMAADLAAQMIANYPSDMTDDTAGAGAGGGG